VDTRKLALADTDWLARLRTTTRQTWLVTLLVGALNVMKLTREFQVVAEHSGLIAATIETERQWVPAATTLTVNVAPVTTVMTGAGASHRGVDQHNEPR